MNALQERSEQSRQWIRGLVNAYSNRLVEKLRAEEKRIFDEQEMRRQRANWIAPEIAGETLWTSLRETLIAAATEFNELYGATSQDLPGTAPAADVMVVSEVSRETTVKIRLNGGPTGSSKSSTVAYFRDAAALRYQTDGGKENSLSVDLNPTSGQMEFAGYCHYFTVEQVSSQIISDLLP